MEKSFTNKELVVVFEKLETATAKDVVLPSKVSYKIVKNKIAIQQALQPFETTRTEIIRQISGGKEAVTYDESPREYNEIIAAIKDIENECSSVEIATIKFDDIPAEGVPISFIAALEFMIEEE